MQEAAGEGGGGRRECIAENKNPTQRCGEKTQVLSPTA